MGSRKKSWFVVLVSRAGKVSGDAIRGGGFREGRGKVGGREGVSCWKGLQTAQTVGVHRRSSTAWPGRIPRSHSFLRSTRSDNDGGDVIDAPRISFPS